MKAIEQGSVKPDFTSSNHPDNRLFLAFIPEGEAGFEVESIAHRLKVKYGLTGRPLGLSRYHVSLHVLGNFAEVPPDLIATIRDTFAPIAACAEPFQIRFDESLSFKSNQPKRPFVLTGSNNKAFSEFSNQLGSRLGLSRRKVDPHLTLLYDAKSISQHPEGPVSWMVDELVLVRSYVGLGRHEHLARWPLLSRSLCLGL